ncbi:MAG: polysaccharide biosynthesis tyrosine autokinase, partial [bacterium]
LDDTIKTPEDLERHQLPFLGSIPAVKLAEVARRLKQEGRPYSVDELDRLESKLVTHFSPRSPVSEAYRTLRTNIQLLNHNPTKKVLMITSAATKEGKSTVLANLGVTVARTGARVLLVDSDLRHPALHEFFGFDGTPGLTDILQGSLTLEQAAKPTDIETLSIVTSGEEPENPSEMTASDAFRDFIETTRQKYDFVLMDSPPLMAVADGVVLASRVDGTLLVVASGFVSPREVNHAISLLRNVGVPFLGVVLNGLDIKKIYGSYYYHFHYYHYHQY